MQHEHRVSSQHPRRIDQSAMRAAFLDALSHRVARDQRGEVVLPAGIVDAVDIGRVLSAIDRIKGDDQR
jgi:hypothetical protein